MSFGLRFCFQASSSSSSGRGSLTNGQESNKSVVNKNNTPDTVQRNQDVSDAVTHPTTPIVRHGANRCFQMFVNKGPWQVAKFLDKKDLLNPTCAIANFCFDQLPHIEDIFGWWNTNWSKIQKILNLKRNSITQRFYKTFQRYVGIYGRKLVENVILTFILYPRACFVGRNANGR